MANVKPHSIRLYRRHPDSCPHKDDSNISLCDCPIWTHGRLHGRRIRHSLGTRSLAAAEAERARLLKAEVTPSAALPATSLRATLAEYIEARDGLADRTRRNYGAKLAQLTRHCEMKNITSLAAVDSTAIEGWLKTLKKQKPRTRRWAYDAASAFFHWCVRKKKIKELPTIGVERISIPKEHAKRPFDHAEIAQIIAAAKTFKAPRKAGRVWANSERQPADAALLARIWAMVMLLLYTGMRISDCIWLRRSSVNFRTGMITFRPIKTHGKIEVKMKLQQPALDALRAITGKSFYFFHEDTEGLAEAARVLDDYGDFNGSLPDAAKRMQDRMWRELRMLLKDAGLEKATIHQFRHSFAVNMLMEGCGIYELKELLGHSDVKITSQYLNLVDSYRDRMARKTDLLRYPSAA